MTRYELLDRIGVGGMAEIFRGKAVAAGGFEKPVAIKRILPHLSQDRRFVELLIAEAKVLSLLKHRNIVQIFDVGLGDDGKYFLVMEYVDGKDIGAVQRALEAKRRRMPFDLVLHIGAEICEALEHAHTARAPDGKPMSLVHRDVSPSNVLLSRSGEVKLTDFGIAKRAEQDGTNSGAVRGKFAYISPEQARNEPLDPRSDVFSVGILLWELVTNRRLFSNLDDLGALRAVRDGQIARPTEIDPRLPPEIDQLLMAALARDRSRRYPSAGQFGAKLRTLRYSLEATVGDPAAELSRIIDSAEEIERQSHPQVPPISSTGFENDGAEATVIRIRTADAFSARDNESSISAARQVIDRFEEEEETRLAQLTGDQMRQLRQAAAPRDSNEMTATAPPLRGLPPRSRRPSEEATRAREPIEDDDDEIPLRTPPGMTPPHEPFGADEATRLHVPHDRRTPPPQRPGTSPPRPRGPSPGQSTKQPLPGMPSPTQVTATPLPSSAIPAMTPASQRVMRPTPSPLPAPPQQPSQQQPMAPMAPPPPQQQPMQGFAPPAPQGLFGGWAPPAAAQRPPPSLAPAPPERPPYIPNTSLTRPSKGLKPWMVVVGALIMALIAFELTRLLLIR